MSMSGCDTLEWMTKGVDRSKHKAAAAFVPAQAGRQVLLTGSRMPSMMSLAPAMLVMAQLFEPTFYLMGVRIALL